MGKLMKTLLFGLLGAAGVGLLSCGSESGSPLPSEPAFTEPEEGPSLSPNVVELGQWQGTWIHSKQELKFTYVEPERSPDFQVGIQPQGFDEVDSGRLTFETNWAKIGPSGDDCAANQLCASVNLSNETSRNLNQVYVEITSLSPAGYAAVNSVAVPSGYPLSNARGLWNYQNLPAINGGSERTWKFNLPGDDDFTFSVRVLAIFTRTSYSVAGGVISPSNNSAEANAAWDEDAPPWRDACLNGQVISSSAEYLTMPFPFTLCDLTFSTEYEEMVITPYGISVDELVAPDQPAVLPNSSYPYSIFPFWEDLTGGQICIDEEGTMPNRRLIVTWKGMQIAGIADSNMTFSTVLQERSDKVHFLYHRWSAEKDKCTAQAATPGALRTRGQWAAAGIEGDGIGVALSKSGGFLLNTHTAPCPGSGQFFTLTATPKNNNFNE